MKGQVALIVMLISAVVMTIGLSLSKKTVVTTSIETSQEQLKQAFNTAESGIDYYLGTGSTVFNAVDNNSTANIVVNNLGGGTTVNFNQYVAASTGVSYWLVGHNGDGTIDFSSYYAGNLLNLCVSTDMVGAMKVDYFYKSGASFLVQRAGYNFTTDVVSGFSNVSNLTQGGCDANYHELTLSLPLGGTTVPLLISVKAIKSGGKVYLTGSGASFPLQGVSISSTGRVGNVNSGASVNRTIEANRYYDVPDFLIEPVTAFGNVLSN